LCHLGHKYAEIRDSELYQIVEMGEVAYTKDNEVTSGCSCSFAASSFTLLLLLASWSFAAAVAAAI